MDVIVLKTMSLYMNYGIGGQKDCKFMLDNVKVFSLGELSYDFDCQSECACTYFIASTAEAQERVRQRARNFPISFYELARPWRALTRSARAHLHPKIR